MINDKRLTKTLQKLIQFNTVNPPGTEYDCSKWIEAYMRNLRLHVTTPTFAKKRPNVIATLKGSLPRKQAQKEAVCIMPHHDVVPVGTGWKYDPFGGTIVGNKMYGRGTSDDKGNTASCIEVMHSLVEQGYKPKRDIIFAATVDEETGSKNGTVALLKSKKVKPELCVVMDSAQYDAIVAQKGLLHCHIEIFGKKAHGAHNWYGHNAIEDAAKIITKLKALKFKCKLHPLLMRGVTMNLGTIQGGDKVNIVADHCSFDLDTRYPPSITEKAILKRVRSTIETVTKKYKITIHDSQKPYEVSKDHEAIKLYFKTLQKHKIKARAKGSEGATVITFFQDHNITAFATGWASHGVAHCTDEYINLKDLHKGTRVLEDYLIQFDQR